MRGSYTSGPLTPFRFAIVKRLYSLLVNYPLQLRWLNESASYSRYSFKYGGINLMVQKCSMWEAYDACYEYDKRRCSVGARILMFAVEIMYRDWLNEVDY